MIINFRLRVITVFFAAGILASGCQRGVQRAEGEDMNVFALRPDASRIIVKYLGDEDPRVQVKAIEIAAVTKRADLCPRIYGLLISEYVPVRYVAAASLGDMGYSPAESRLREILLKDTDENAKLGYSYALYKLGDKSKFDAIKEALKSKDETLRANAAVLLGKCGQKSELDLLYWAMTDKNSTDKVSLQAAAAIAMLGDEKIYPRLWTLLISVYADDRVLGVEAMGNLGTLEAKDSLKTMLDDAVLDVRIAAASALGRLGDTIGSELVAKVLSGEADASLPAEDLERVRIQAALAIGSICSEQTKAYLADLLTDNSKMVQLAAAKSVFECTATKPKLTGEVLK